MFFTLKTMPNENPIWTKSFFCLVLSLLLLVCSNYYTLSTISEYAELISGPGIVAGIITSSFFVGSLCMRIPAGWLIQKFGAYKIMAAGAILTSITCFAQYWAGLILLIIFRLIQGTGFSLFATAGNVAASCMIPRKRLTEGMGYFTLGFVLSMSIAPAIALTIISVPTIANFKILFALGGASAALSLVLLMLAKNKQMDNASFFKVKHAYSLKHLPKTFLGFEKGVFYPTLLNFLMTLGFSPAIIYLAGYGLEKGWTNIGFVFTIYSGGLLIVRLFTGKISDKYSPDFIMIPSYITVMLSFFLLMEAQSELTLELAMGLVGMCVGAHNPEIVAFCFNRCTKYRRGTASAAYTTAFDLAYVVSGVLFGEIIYYFGYNWMFITSIIFFAAALVIYLFTLSSLAKALKHRILQA